jgi:hypothetical protein
LLLIAGLSGTQVKEARMVVSVDAGLILNDGPSAKIVRQMVEAVGDVPLGVCVTGMSEQETSQLADLGCDFVVFGIKAAAAALHKEEVGKILMIEPSLDLGFVRAINSLGVDGVFVNLRGGGSFVAVEHLLVCRRLVDLLEKPVMIALPSLVTKAELTSIWQAGVDGVVVPPSQSTKAMTELKEMIGDLPRGARGRRAKVDVILPRYGEGVAGEDDEETEEI